MSSVDINLEICGESHQQGRQGNINSINDGHIKILLPTYIIPLTTGSCHSKTIKRILYMDVKRFVLSRVILLSESFILFAYIIQDGHFIIEWECFLLVLLPTRNQGSAKKWPGMKDNLRLIIYFFVSSHIISL